MDDKYCLPSHQFVVLSGIAQMTMREVGCSRDEFCCMFSPDMGSEPWAG